jgi:hypothetical protein
MTKSRAEPILRSARRRCNARHEHFARRSNAGTTAAADRSGSCADSSGANDPVAAGEDAIERGECLTRAGSCFSCHTAACCQPLAGGRALATPFGTFYTPNITPDRRSGLAVGPMRNSCGRCARRCGPMAPTTSRCSLSELHRRSDSDALAIKAYLFSRSSVPQNNRPHDVAFPFSWRLLQTVWKWLFFTPGRFLPDPDRSAIADYLLAQPPIAHDFRPEK